MDILHDHNCFPYSNCNLYKHLSICSVLWNLIFFTFFAFIPSLDTERVLSGKELFHCIFFSNEVVVKYHR